MDYIRHFGRRVSSKPICPSTGFLMLADRWVTAVDHAINSQAHFRLSIGYQKSLGLKQ
jgi:hypothetical protein